MNIFDLLASAGLVFALVAIALMVVAFRVRSDNAYIQPLRLVIAAWGLLAGICNFAAWYLGLVPLVYLVIAGVQAVVAVAWVFIWWFLPPEVNKKNTLTINRLPNFGRPE